MTSKKRKKITRSDIRMFLDSLPPKAKVPLKDSLTTLTPEQVMENIENRTKLGREYYLQIAKALLEKESKPQAFEGDSGIILA